jgi:hypothetical protein
MRITSESIKDQIPSYLSQKDKESLVRALDDFPRRINYYIDLYPNEALQGDGWTSVEIIRFENGDRKMIKAILLSNSCDIDPENKRDLPIKLTFAPVIKLDRYFDYLTKAGVGDKEIEHKTLAIKEQRVSSLIYLPEGAGLDGDYVALLNDLHTVPYAAFSSKNERKKLFTLSNVGFYLFVLKLSVHFCRLHEEVLRGDPA